VRRTRLLPGHPAHRSITAQRPGGPISLGWRLSATAPISQWPSLRTIR